ncbi:MAG: hypothetical protein ABIR77_08930 [Sphingomicrobium sp.]
MLLVIAVALATANPTLALAEARHALTAGRLEQAQRMVDLSVTAGAGGEPVEQLRADLAFANRDWTSAAPLLAVLADRHPADALLAERAGIAALERGDGERAARLLARATALPGASWRAWNALGVLADRSDDWSAADEAYARAAALAPDRAEISNNRGWSLLLRGRWRESELQLARAAAIAPASRRIADNLELARAALAADLPARFTDESDDDWAARLNDAGVAAAVRGERARAVAAFARAIELRAKWNHRTAANLAAIERQR